MQSDPSGRGSGCVRSSREHERKKNQDCGSDSPPEALDWPPRLCRTAHERLSTSEKVLLLVICLSFNLQVSVGGLQSQNKKTAVVGQIAFQQLSEQNVDLEVCCKMTRDPDCYHGEF